MTKEEYDKLPYKLQHSIDYIKDVYNEGELAKQELQKRIDDLSNFQPSQTLIRYKLLDAKPIEATYAGYQQGYVKKPLMTVEQLTSLWDEDKVIYQKNLLICDENKKRRDTVINLLKRLGLKTEERKQVGRRTKWQICTAAWVTEVNAQFAMSTGNPDNWYLDNIREVNELLVKQKKEMEARQLKQENELKAQKVAAAIVSTINKYEFKFSMPIPPLEEVIQALVKKNKVLNLAHAMILTRDSWSEGCYLVRDALKEFDAITDEEKEWVSSIQSLVENWEGDGRVFRDTCYNYNYLFSVVSENHPDLLRDYENLKELE